nr:CDP-glycerol glycerophosphotransferase family protein [Lachnospiraceae bacterium]
TGIRNMKLSVIWICEGSKKKYAKTLASLQKEFSAKGLQTNLLVYSGDHKHEKEIGEEMAKLQGAVTVSFFPFPEECIEVESNKVRHFVRPDLVYVDACEKIKGSDTELVTMVYSGDTFSEGALKKISGLAAKYPEQKIYMMKKIMAGNIMEERNEGVFACSVQSWKFPKKEGVVSLSQDVSCHPFYLGGTFLRTQCFVAEGFACKYPIEAERKFFLDLCMKEDSFVFTGKASYHTDFPYEGDTVFYRRLYRKEYYMEAIHDFWLPYLADLKAEKGEIPEFVQYHILMGLRSRYIGNFNNKNKHAIEGSEDEFFSLVTDLLMLLDDPVILNGRNVEECRIGPRLSWIFGIMKHGPEYKYHLMESKGPRPGYGDAGVMLRDDIKPLKVDIKFMDARDGKLEIDGQVGTLLYSMADEVYFMYGGKKYEIEYNGRYALQKAFGISIYKTHPFHLTLEDLNVHPDEFACYARFGDQVYQIHMAMSGHFCRVSPRFPSNYWTFKMGGRYLVTKKRRKKLTSLRIRRTILPVVWFYEFMLLLQMLFSFDLRAKLFIAIRLCYFVTRPFIKRRPIWMYLDKIYKGGDSAEYLYKYAVAQNDGNKHYYLIDKNTPDYKRLVAEGYKPLIRGSVLHRLIFLMADYMVISNSTVFAFNNFGTINSSYVRNLTDFHVCCVQHGMSVQKIALAQTRLRDNTRLYFCASKYEIKNLSHPVYDYVGYDALKLTGVPRYDGLKSDDKKQILITPTWRMQSAVPIRGSEGYQRDYNPMFKETPYYRIYNGLICDKRLLEAANKYGYKIKYVLHPIVSSQAKDYTPPEGVEVIPAVGDMSYEKLFCESSLMVTDFSGVQFDFAYMKKPVLYLHHKDIPQHYEEGSFFYDTMAFGEIARDNEELIDLLIEYMKDGCPMKEKYQERVDDFFHYHDHNNCERIYKVMQEYQDKYILRK